MLAESGIIPTNVVSDLVEKQKKHENIIDIAVYAMLSDGIIQEQEVELLNQLSMALIGAPIEKPIETPSKSIKSICEETKDAIDKKTLIETAIRVVCIDGKLKDSERDFINLLNTLLDINCDLSNTIINFAERLSDLNSVWSDIEFNVN